MHMMMGKGCPASCGTMHGRIFRAHESQLAQTHMWGWMLGLALAFMAGMVIGAKKGAIMAKMRMRGGGPWMHGGGGCHHQGGHWMGPGHGGPAAWMGGPGPHGGMGHHGGKGGRQGAGTNRGDWTGPTESGAPDYQV